MDIVTDDTNQPPEQSPQSNMMASHEAGLRKLEDDAREMLLGFKSVVDTMGKGLDFVRECGNDPAMLVMMSRRFRDIEDALDALRKRFNSVQGKLDESIIPDAFDGKVTTITSGEGDRGTVSTKVYASIPADNREAAYDWLRNNNYAEMITETVNASSLSSLAKEIMEENRELPDDIFRVHEKSKLSLTRSKKRKSPFLDLLA